MGTCIGMCNEGGLFVFFLKKKMKEKKQEVPTREKVFVMHRKRTLVTEHTTFNMKESILTRNFMNAMNLEQFV